MASAQVGPPHLGGHARGGCHARGHQPHLASRLVSSLFGVGAPHLASRLVSSFFGGVGEPHLASRLVFLSSLFIRGVGEPLLGVYHPST